MRNFLAGPDLNDKAPWIKFGPVRYYFFMKRIGWKPYAAALQTLAYYCTEYQFTRRIERWKK